MYTGDFCGTGAAYTAQGTPLRWENSKKWVTLPASVASFESLWSSGGAMCLDEHRLGPDWTDFINGTGLPGAPPGVCPKPSCGSLFGFPSIWQRPAYLLTATPL